MENNQKNIRQLKRKLSTSQSKTKVDACKEKLIEIALQKENKDESLKLMKTFGITRNDIEDHLQRKINRIKKQNSILEKRDEELKKEQNLLNTWCF